MSTPEAKLALAQVERLIVEHTALSTEVVELRLEMIPLREANRALRAERDAALAEAEELRDSLKTSEAVRETYRMAILGMDAERDALRAELAAIPWAALRSAIERALRYRSQEWVTVWQWLRTGDTAKRR